MPTYQPQTDTGLKYQPVKSDWLRVAMLVTGLALAMAGLASYLGGP